jgi:hypothetical protein
MLLSSNHTNSQIHHQDTGSDARLDNTSLGHTRLGQSEALRHQTLVLSDTQMQPMQALQEKTCKNNHMPYKHPIKSNTTHLLSFQDRTHLARRTPLQCRNYRSSQPGSFAKVTASIHHT